MKNLKKRKEKRRKIMLPFMKSDIGTVRQRIRKPAITAGLFFGVLLLDVIFRQHRLGYFLTSWAPS